METNENKKEKEKRASKKKGAKEDENGERGMKTTNKGKEEM